MFVQMGQQPTFAMASSECCRVGDRAYRVQGPGFRGQGFGFRLRG